jgi:DNA-binding response OmpR family regulator
MATAVLTVTAAIMTTINQTMRLLSVTHPPGEGARLPYADSCSNTRIRIACRSLIVRPREACRGCLAGITGGWSECVASCVCRGDVTPVLSLTGIRFAQRLRIGAEGKEEMSAAPSILIVDDDPRLCRALARYFEREGYSVRTATSGAEMRQKLALERPDLVLLDLMLPDEDGFSLARELRASSDMAVVILTGKADTVDKVVGLELGADDYVTKPFDERELLARVRSVLRRASAGRAGTTDADGTVARFAGWTLDLDSYELTSPAGEPVSLTSHEFQLLAAFARHPNRVLTRDAIMDLIAGRNWSPEDRSVDVLVGKLRKKMEEDPQNPRLIETVRGVGYKLSVRVAFE